MFEYALFVAGVISIWFFLVPQAYSWVRPFSCEFCLTVWLSIAICFYEWYWNVPSVIFIAALLLQAFRALQELTVFMYDRYDTNEEPAESKGY